MTPNLTGECLNRGNASGTRGWGHKKAKLSGSDLAVAVGIGLSSIFNCT